MNYSPKLKKAMLQIDEIMKENDIGGAVILHDNTYGGHGEDKLYLSPSYSCAEIKDGVGIRFKTKDTEEANQTSNLFRTIVDMFGILFSIIEPVSSKLDKRLGATHTPSPITGNLQIEN